MAEPLGTAIREEALLSSTRTQAYEPKGQAVNGDRKGTKPQPCATRESRGTLPVPGGHGVGHWSPAESTPSCHGADGIGGSDTSLEERAARAVCDTGVSLEQCHCFLAWGQMLCTTCGVSALSGTAGRLCL